MNCVRVSIYTVRVCVCVCVWGGGGWLRWIKVSAWDAAYLKCNTCLWGEVRKGIQCELLMCDVVSGRGGGVSIWVTITGAISWYLRILIATPCNIWRYSCVTLRDWSFCYATVRHFTDTLRLHYNFPLSHLCAVSLECCRSRAPMFTLRRQSRAKMYSWCLQKERARNIW